MCLLFETIKIIDGKPANIARHNERMNAARKELFSCSDMLDLREIIAVPEQNRSGRHKCRVVYAKGICEITFEPYPGRSIKSLKIVHCDDIEYPHKYCNRDNLNALFRLRGNCDDILIQKREFVTDTSISNIAFFNGTRWLTPRSALLRGTKREHLLAEGLIAESDISAADIRSFEKASLINAMLDLGEITIPAGSIVF